MEIFNKVRVFGDIDNLSFNKPVVTMGVFDGLHLGHRRLLRSVLEKARETGGESVVLTFWPHPRIVLGKAGDDLRLLSTLEEKKYLLKRWGLENLIIVPFTREFAGISGRDFVREVLIGRIGMKHFVIGDDHRFGSDRSGGRELLEEMSGAMGFSFTSLGSELIGGSRISSSQVRKYLNSGELDKANQLLGFNYFMFGKVVPGNRLGRTIGFPTANIQCCVDNKQVPEEGVYAVEVEFNSSIYGGMLNIGIRPTVDNTRRKSIEVHIFELKSDLYGKKLKVSFLHRLRDEMRFNSTDELRAQLIKDKARAISMLRPVK